MADVFGRLAHQLRPLAEGSLPSVATLEVRTRVRIPGGGATDAYAPFASGIPCRVTPMPLPQNVALTAGELRALVRWMVAFPMSTDVREDMRVTVDGADDDGTAWRRTMIVVAVNGPRTYEVLREALCTDESPGGR